MPATNDWRYVWHEGLVPQLPPAGLRAFARALAEDSPALMQKCTYFPKACESNRHRPIEKACGLAYVIWQGYAVENVWEADTVFCDVVSRCDVRMRELGRPELSAYTFISWFDDTDWPTVRGELLPEVEAAVRQKESGG
jgi:hypothetical protein